jgi:NADPH:quinone reductase-like Zn-dependent oxidoreductase
MKAIVYTKYGSPDILELKEIEKPTPKDDEVLIQISAASVNPLDWHIMRGSPFILRVMTGLFKPRITRLGRDVAGKIESVGRNVTLFKKGDEVFGSCTGAFAEYVCVSELKLVLKPDNITFEQAATLNIAALTALQSLRDKGRIKPGQKVLINGASGGVGTFAVQLAKVFNTEVTGVCSTNNIEMVRSIGADYILDYTKEDVTKTGKHYDIFLDCYANRSLLACKRVLNSGGIYIAVGGPVYSLISILISSMTAIVLSWFVSQKFVSLLTKINRDDLTFIGELMASGKVKAVVGRQYKLSEVPEAIRYIEDGHTKGKVVILIEHKNNN